MWVDLVEESKLVNENCDDEWFHKSHLFHQCSARQLRAAFGHSAEGSDFFNSNSHGVKSSPKLDSSVSKSRGKCYKVSNWKTDDFGHPVKDLSCRSSRLDAGTFQEYQPKLGCANTNTFSRIASASSEVISTHGDMKSGSTSLSMVASEGDSTSTVTTEFDQQQNPNILATSKQMFSQTSGLLSSLRINLTKSCAMRQALRVEISIDNESKCRKSSSSKSSTGSFDRGCKAKKTVPSLKQNKVRAFHNRESKGRISSSGKSSVGSSNPRYTSKDTVHGFKDKKDGTSDGEFKGFISSSGYSLNLRYEVEKIECVTKHIKDATSNGSNRMKMLQATNRVNFSKVKKAVSVEARNVTHNANARTSSAQEAAKSKVPLQTVQTRNSESLRVNVKHRSSSIAREKEKRGNIKSNRVASSAKENLTRSMVMSKISEYKNKMAVPIVGDRKTKQLKVTQIDGREVIIGSKGKYNGEAVDGKQRATKGHRVYFR
ncbi:hypothetical protein Nepgr_016239 [Nepenthes gracilis]|uniref:Uncharacterized protein n=1 Tax=Nepenthes gracilis TaxID=150966 RepID=A0AAD3XRF6_NEPGR|nr:hypothetical protein Nepgr_016239 [Nepenthes gracilis]